MLICIVGKSGSGKDTIARLLKTWYKFKAVCSYTSRPKRESEVEGREHYFISKEEAQTILKERADEVVAQTTIGENIYFALKENLEAADVYVIDPKGIEYIKEHFPDIEIFQLYVYCDDEVARQRALNRGDDVEVYDARHEAEDKMFNDYYESKKYDAVINNSVTEEKMIVNLMELIEENIDVLNLI